MKKLLIILILNLAIAGAGLATVLDGAIGYSANPGDVPSVADLKFVSYVNNSDDKIITEAYSNAYQKIIANGNTYGVWTVNTSSFNAAQDGTFTIIFHALGKTKTITGINYSHLIGTFDYPETTILDVVATLAKPVLSTSAGDGQLTISWASVTGASQYKLYRSTANNGYFEKVSDNAVSPYLDKNLVNGQAYYYLLVATDGVQTSEHSDAAAGTPKAGLVVLQSIAVTPANPTILAGQTQQFAATGTYSNGTTGDLSDQVVWSSSDNAKATIDAHGLAAAVAEGSTNITATLNGVTSPAQTLTINPIQNNNNNNGQPEPGDNSQDNGGQKNNDQNQNNNNLDQKDNSQKNDENQPQIQAILDSVAVVALPNNDFTVAAKREGQVVPADLYTAVWSVSGAEYGNTIDVNGHFTPGSQEGAFAVSAVVTAGGQKYVAQATANVDLGAPKVTVLNGTAVLTDNQVVGSKVKLKIKASDGNGVKTIKIYVDGLLSNQASALDITSASYDSELQLSPGTHSIRVEAQDELGSAGNVAINGLTVYSDLLIVGAPKNYPNPFKPAAGQSTIINFQLSQAADLKIYIYDLAGRVLSVKTLAAAAGENEVSWDGKDAFGQVVGNGAYAYFITENGKLLGKGGMAVYE